MIPEDYLPVVDRVTAMRKDHPAWQLVTELLDDTQDRVLMRAVLRDGADIVATAYAEEPRTGRRFVIETCETSAVGRVLRFAGYPDKKGLTEEEHLRAEDTPAAPPAEEPMPPTIVKKNARIDSMQRLMFRLFNEAGITHRDAMLATIEQTIGRKVESRNELTRSELEAVIAAIPRPQEAE